MTDITSLAAYRDAKQGGPPPRSEPSPIIFVGSLVAFDQSIANTGWVKVTVTEAGKFLITDTGNCKTEQGPKKGHIDTLTRATSIHHQMAEVLARTNPKLVVHEAIPIGSKVRGMGESSLTSALALHIACSTRGLPIHIVNRQRGATLLTGNGNAEKPEVAAAVRTTIGVEGIKPMNQAIYDAISIAWVAVREVTGVRA